MESHALLWEIQKRVLGKNGADLDPEQIWGSVRVRCRMALGVIIYPVIHCIKNDCTFQIIAKNQHTDIFLYNYMNVFAYIWFESFFP